eukprot:TRINITY_DN13247_c0_g1_i3.p1 TRINITY_DN13247_c0_g1~~TRINITY_DN13247_c0_g1_i3.p1  ORF type:complete len:532 (+),score=78.12 TRINITY_DN13247_c0_g1_i3:151-1746(+)
MPKPCWPTATEYRKAGQADAAWGAECLKCNFREPESQLLFSARPQRSDDVSLGLGDALDKEWSAQRCDEVAVDEDVSTQSEVERTRYAREVPPLDFAASKVGQPEPNLLDAVQALQPEADLISGADILKQREQSESTEAITEGFESPARRMPTTAPPLEEAQRHHLVETKPNSGADTFAMEDEQEVFEPKAEKIIPAGIEIAVQTDPINWTEETLKISHTLETLGSSGCNSTSSAVSRNSKSTTLKKNWKKSTTSELLVEAWTGDPWVMSTLRSHSVHWVLQMQLFLVLVVAVGVVLGVAGVFFAQLFASADWHGKHRHKLIMLLILGSIFTGWNIAQYASLTIQTTGHLTPMQHFRSIRKHWKYILGPCLSGWSLALFSAFVLPSDGIVFHALLVLVPSIVSGIVCKTYCKLQYIWERGETGYCADENDDCLSGKAARNADFGVAPICPFPGVKTGLVLRTAFKPFLCFVWAVLYAVAFRLLILASKKLPGGLVLSPWTSLTPSPFTRPPSRIAVRHGLRGCVQACCRHD